MINRFVEILTLIVVILTARVAVAQNLGFYQEASFVTSYENTMFGSSVYIFDMEEDANGSMLLASTDGLFVMNSDNVQLYKTSTNFGITKLAIDKNHNVFVVGYCDLGYFAPQKDGGMKFFSLGQNIDLVQEKFFDIVVVDNYVYFVGRDNIFVYDYKVFRKVEIGGISRIYKLGNRIFVYTSNGILSLFDGRFSKEIFDLKKLKINTKNIHFISFNADSLFIGDNNLLCSVTSKIIDSGKRLQVSDFKFLNYESITEDNVSVSDIVYDKLLNKVAISTNKGIWIYNDGGVHVQTINFVSGLPYEDVKRLYFDSHHNLWAILSTAVAKIELNTSTVYYSHRQGLGNSIKCFASYKGNFYCGAFDCLNCAQIDTKSNSPTSFKHVLYDNLFVDNTCWDLPIFEGLLLACTGHGLYQVEGLSTKLILDIPKIYSINSSKFYPGKIFISSLNGLYVGDYQKIGNTLKFSNIKLIDGLQFPIASVTFDKNSNLWISSVFEGIFYMVPKDKEFYRYSVVNLGKNIGFSNPRLIPFSVDDGFLNLIYDKTHIYAKLPDKTDFLANEIKFQSDSLLRFPKSEVKDLFLLDSLGDIFVHSGNNYMIANKLSDNSYRIDTLIFKQKINSIYRLEKRDSLLFLATDIGLLKRNLKSKQYGMPEKYPFNVLISSISVNDSSVFSGVKYFDDKNLRLYSNANNKPDDLGSDIYSLKFTYSSTSFENSEQITYSYLLEGQDDEWSDYTTQSQHEFGQLSPGTYRFNVKAKNCAGVVSDVAVYDFKIDFPWYFRWWALLTYILLGIALIYYFVRIKTRRLHKENIKLERIASERSFEILRQNEQLRLLSLVASTTKNAIIILDSKGLFEYVNDSFKEIYDYSLEEYKKAFGDNYFEAESKKNTEHTYLINEAVKTKKSQSFENYHIKHNLQKVWVQITMDPLFDSNGNICNWIICESNITLLKAADQESLMQNQALTEAYMNLSERQVQIEFQKQQLMAINQRLETGYKQLNRQNLTIKESLRYAQSIQNSILPSNEQISEFLDFFIIYLPKDIVSGDFYIYEKLSEKSFIVIVSDCTGHGVPGAFMSIIGHNILTQIIKNQKITNPVEILELLNDKLQEVLKQDVEQNSDGMDLCICKFDRNSDGNYDITFSGSRSSIYIYSKSKNHLTRIRGSHRQIGWGTEFSKLYTFENHNFAFEKDDFMIMLSDGLVDQCNAQRRRFGSERFSEFVVLHSDLPMREMGNELVKTLKDFMAGTEQRDDITVFGFTSKFN